MSKRVTLYKLLIASPSDVQAEREEIVKAVHAWNATNLDKYNAVIHPVLWETHSVPEMGDRPQAILNNRLLSDCDMLIGVFWTRIGSHTGKAESGTIEEIQEFLSSQKPVSLYFSSRPVIPESIDPDQYNRLMKFKSECRDSGIVYEYNDIADFNLAIFKHLSTLIQRFELENEDQFDNENPEPLSINEDPIEIFKAQIEEFIRGIEAEWEGERDSDPTSIEEGTYIIQNLCDHLVDFRKMITEDKSGELAGLFSDALIKSKKLTRHQVYMDGGKSYREFWEIGDQILSQIKEIPKLLERAKSF